MKDTLFGHLATRFGTHPENLATEALGYILRRSSHAREALCAMLAQVGVAAPASLTFRNQVAGDDDAQPDLVGLDEAGRQRLLIEAKFWAGLTERQPVTYLGRLPKDGGALVVVAPGARVTLLWAELVRRCQNAGLSAEQVKPALDEANLLALVDGRKLVILSWRILLDFLVLHLESADDRATREDVVQLRGLCARMDNEAFLPLMSEELTTQVYRRVIQFGSIVNDVAGLLIEKKLANNKGLRSAAANGHYGRYLSLKGVGVFLICDVRKWMKFASTPLWLSVYGRKWRNNDPVPVRQALASLERMNPPRMFMAGDGYPTVPLFVPLGEERDGVIKSVLQQVEHVATLLDVLPPLVVAPGERPAAGPSPETASSEATPEVPEPPPDDLFD